MLQLIVELVPEGWDEGKEEFVPAKTQTLQLEHSLVSVKKWESKWNRSFLSSKKEMTIEETIDYIRCMTLTQNVKPEVYRKLSAQNIKEVNEYIQKPMTATTFSDRGGKKPNNEIVTAELIYYWMISLGIPIECQKWHINQLITLIRVCSIKNTPPGKVNKNERIQQYAALNAARRKQLNSKG